jgi:hypothetical protein
VNFIHTICGGVSWQRCSPPLPAHHRSGPSPDFHACASTLPPQSSALPASAAPLRRGPAAWLLLPRRSESELRTNRPRFSQPPLRPASRLRFRRAPSKLPANRVVDTNQYLHIQRQLADLGAGHDRRAIRVPQFIINMPGADPFNRQANYRDTNIDQREQMTGVIGTPAERQLDLSKDKPTHPQMFSTPRVDDRNAAAAAAAAHTGSGGTPAAAAAHTGTPGGRRKVGVSSDASLPMPR